MRAFISGLLALIFLMSVAPGTVAQAGVQQGECTEFQAYWEALVGTVPDDPDGLEALLHIFGAGTLTVITEEQKTAAQSFLASWSRNVDRIDPSLIPQSARLFHPELVDDIDFTGSLIEYSDIDDLSTMFSFTPIGIYILLIEEEVTTPVCS